MPKDKNAQSRDFVQKLQEYNNRISLLEKEKLSEKDQDELLKLKTERQRLIFSETQEAMDTIDEWLPKSENRLPGVKTAQHRAESEPESKNSTPDQKMEMDDDR